MAQKARRPPVVRATVVTDTGRVRAANEDAFAVLPQQGLFLVADGMGGHQAGATASGIVASVLPKMIEQRLAQTASQEAKVLARALRDAIMALSQQLREQSLGRPGLAGMGSTVVLAFVRGERAFVAHMGDSRAYLLRSDRLQPLTADHSVVGILLRQGEITPEQARLHPARNRLSRYVGMQGDVHPDVHTVRLLAGDRLLLCTDGLTAMVPDEEIGRLLGEGAGPRACEALVEAANASGGKDNVTVLVLDCQPG